MVGLADVYDALTTDRPYRPPLPPHQALEMMFQQANQFEPRLLARFTEMLGAYPAGSSVRLSDGRLAVVSRPNSRHSTQPYVRLLDWEEGIPVLAEQETDLSVMGASGKGFALSVEAPVDPGPLGLDVCSLLGGNPYYSE